MLKRCFVLFITASVLAIACAPAAAPAAPAQPTAAPAAPAPTTPAAPAPTTPAAPAPTTPAAPAPTTQPSAAPLDGGVELTLVSGANEARYRVREELANVSAPFDAIGKTQQVSGAIVLDKSGKVVPAQSKITINLASLTSDESRRDGYVQRRTLETSQFPNAIFTVTEVTGLPAALPNEGDHTFKLTGDFHHQGRHPTRQLGRHRRVFPAGSDWLGQHQHYLRAVRARQTQRPDSPDPGRHLEVGD